ncbi:MAG TPA: IS66 family transposase, partial [Spirochaetia bacterium]|nr:IS66 family transposase [Spirochaetia bacterium]
SEKLDVIPAQFVALRIVRPKYACTHCEGSADEDKPAVRIAAMPKAIIERGIATPGLLAFVITAKYVDGLPLARQEKQFARMGIELSRKRLSDWVLAVGEALTPVIAELLHELRSGPILLADETTVQVLGEPDRPNTSLSYMWAGYGGNPRHPSVYFHYSEHRLSAAAEELIGTYEGYLQTDAYEVYDRIAEGRPALIHVGCWAHARRKFFDAAQAAKKTGAAQAGLALIATLYQIEQELAGEPRTESFAAVRRERAQAALEKLHTWLEQKTVQVPPTTALGQAVAYTLGMWEKLIRYLDHPELTPDTNRVENKIRPFVIGRKNWLFSGSPTGAQAAANLYSHIETAKANNLEPYRYLRALIERLPFAASPQDYRALLPQFIQIPTG